jgi:hypothetical protein
MFAALLDKVSLGIPSAYRNLTLTPILLKDGPLSAIEPARRRRSTTFVDGGKSQSLRSCVKPYRLRDHSPKLSRDAEHNEDQCDGEHIGCSAAWYNRHALARGSFK